MSFTHLHLMLNHFPVIGAALGIALLGFAVLQKSDELGKVSLGVRHTEIRSGVIRSASASQENPD